MSSKSSQFYVSMLEFLMTAKQNVIMISKDYGLTSMQAITLLLTKNTMPRPMNSFCKLYNCDASNITGIVDGLEEKGLVTRSEQADDRRVKVIVLTAAGIALQQEIIDKINGTEDSILGGLDQTERIQFEALINKLAIHQLS